MKRIYSLLFICLLAASCGHRESLRQRAYHALDTVTRLYEAGNDSIDAALLEPALAYFPEKGDASTKAKLWYQWGYISLTHGDYDKAIVSFEKGLEQARIIGDYHLEGLICRAMADTYNRTFNIREDTVYLRRAMLAFGAENGPWRIISRSLAVRWLRPRQHRCTASSRLVFPAPFSPTSTVTPGGGVSSS